MEAMIISTPPACSVPATAITRPAAMKHKGLVTTGSGQESEKSGLAETLNLF